MKYKKSFAIIIMLLCISLGHPASVGILIEKSSAMLKASVKGFKSVAGADVLELDMQKNAANPKLSHKALD